MKKYYIERTYSNGNTVGVFVEHSSIQKAVDHVMSLDEEYREEKGGKYDLVGIKVTLVEGR